jgi:N-hydroxyarylamine O-acetyltransferase
VQSRLKLEAYLDRIGYTGTPSPELGVLRELHLRHMLTVPFENLDIPLQRSIALDLERIYTKIVGQRRGGFCYEQNGLFAWALRQIGFDVTMLSARVARSDGTYSPEFAHMLLLVRVGAERWIADVGFGDSFRQPLRLDLTGPQADFGLEYHVAQEEGEYFLRRREGEVLQPKYAFKLQPREFGDYASMCHFQQTSPESHFTRRLVCSLATPTGRITLTDRSMLVTDGSNKTETPIATADEFETLLRQHFGFRLKGFRVPMPGRETAK